jgi:hypothetical protein
MRIHRITTWLVLTLLSAASASDAAVVLLHEYTFNGTLNDSQGGPAIASEGGHLNTGTTYTFGANQGLTLTSPGLTNPGTYSIEMRLSLDAVVGGRDRPWIKLIDFKNLTSDAGLYSYNPETTADSAAALQFFTHTATSDVFMPGQFVHVVITRDDATKQVTAYGGGGSQLSFVDGPVKGGGGDSAVFSDPQQIMRFLQDDVSPGDEAASGQIDFIRINNSVLSASEVSTLAAATAVPEASSFVVVGLAGALAGAWQGKRRRSTAVSTNGDRGP